MDKPLNYSITEVKGKNQTFKVIARVKRGNVDKRKSKTITGSLRTAHKCGRCLVNEIEEYFEKLVPTGSLKNLSECISYYDEYKGIKPKDAFYFKRLKSELGHIEVLELKPFFMMFRDKLSKEYTNRGKLTSNGTINRYTSWIQSVLNFCVTRDLIEKNPLGKIPKLRELPRTRILKEEEVEALLGSIKQYRPYLLPIVQYALIIPSRRSLLVNMKRDWVDLATCSIHVPAEFTKHKQHDDVKPIPPSMLEYFKSIPKESEYVFFRSTQGKFVTLGDFKHAWAYCLKKAGIKDLRVHDLRHHSATMLLSNGKLSERIIMQIGNWASTKMFDTYYNLSGLKASQQVFEVLKDATNVPPNMPL